MPVWRVQRDAFQSTPLTRHEGRHTEREHGFGVSLFQSTPLTRGETLAAMLANQTTLVFQSAPLTRGKTVRLEYDRRAKEISIRSPHARGDCAAWMLRNHRVDFNPLPSCEGRRYDD